MDHESCRFLLSSLSDYVDGELGDELCAEIDRHLQSCDNCRIVIDSLKKTVYLYHVTSMEPPMVPDDVRERLYTRLDLSEYLDRK
jgi:predicted anti-sigma-YlaC factor YlaD